MKTGWAAGTQIRLDSTACCFRRTRRWQHHRIPDQYQGTELFRRSLFQCRRQFGFDRYDLHAQWNGTCSKSSYKNQNSCQSNGKTWTPASHGTWNGCGWDCDQDDDTLNTAPVSSSSSTLQHDPDQHQFAAGSDFGHVVLLSEQPGTSMSSIVRAKRRRCSTRSAHHSRSCASRNNSG